MSSALPHAMEPESLPASRALPAHALIAYGFLRAPLALLELPLFVLLPAFYGRDAGLPLAVVGGVLFAARLIDAIADIESFWGDNYANVYDDTYSKLSGGVHPAYPDNTSTLPSGCAFAGDYQDVVDNAFYCDEGDFIVYDDAGLFPEFANEFGPVTVAVILAHEWGHAIQSSYRHGILYSYASTTIELQADCFAGAWVGHVRENGLNGYSISQSDITGALLGLVQIGDAPGDSAYGGGWYTLTGRTNFGFEVSAVPKTSPVQYKGQLVWGYKGAWRFKGTLSSYTKTTATSPTTSSPMP